LHLVTAADVHYSAGHRSDDTGLSYTPRPKKWFIGV
jgi:hypothetical protein